MVAFGRTRYEGSSIVGVITNQQVATILLQSKTDTVDRADIRAKLPAGESYRRKGKKRKRGRGNTVSHLLMKILGRMERAGMIRRLNSSTEIQILDRAALEMIRTAQTHLYE